MSHTFRTGDVVKHGPTGEEWVVAWADERDMLPCGWPETLARTADCELVEAATDEANHAMLVEVAKSSGYRGSRARRALAEVDRTRPGTGTPEE